MNVNPNLQIFWLAIFMFVTIIIVSRGVSSGLEAGNKIMMPLLFALLIVLSIYALQTSGAASGLDFLLRPQWQKIGPTAVLEALGQALFYLSLGVGTMITYGSYLSRRSNLVSSTFFIAAGDTLVAVLAGLVVFPLAFSFGLEHGAGPGLIFRTLPIAFAPGGYWVALGFFILLSFAAITSSISLLRSHQLISSTNTVGREAEPVGSWGRDLLAGSSFGHWRTVPGGHGCAVDKLSLAHRRPADSGFHRLGADPQ